MLVDEAAKLPAKRWAIDRARTTSTASRAVASFKALLKASRPDVEFVAEQWPALGKLEAASTVQAILAARPEAIFNVDLRRRPAAAGAGGQPARAVPDACRSSACCRASPSTSTC